MSRTHRILVVEDNEPLNELLASTLEGKGFAVRSAANGEEGLRLALDNPPDLIVSDLVMPILNGDGLCQRVRREPRLKRVVFVLLSAHVDLESKLLSPECGADDFLAKPFRTEEFLECVEAALRLHASRGRASGQSEAEQGAD